MKKVIFLSDTIFMSKLNDKKFYRHEFTKNSSGLRLTYSLRKKGIFVFPIYNYTTFSNSDFEDILKYHSDNGKHQLYVCFSTSFMLPGQTQNPQDVWGKFINITIKFLELSKKYKAVTVMGGWALNDYHFPPIPSTLIDLFVIGDGSNILAKLTDENQPLAKEDGHFISKNNYKIFVASNIRDFSDQASSPLPIDQIMQSESLATGLSDGCIFSCSFCNFKLLGKKKYDFVRSYDSLKQEFKSNYENFGTTIYTFTDNIVNDYIPKLEMLIKIRDELKIDIKWVGYSRLDIIKTKEHAQLLKDSGVVGLSFGVESFTKSVGPYFGKMTDGDRIKEHLHLLRDVLKDDVLIHLSLIAGAPTETVDMINKNVEFIRSPEGEYLIDGIIYLPLLIQNDISNKNDINKARNNPFRDYTIKSKSEWSSPWGNSETFRNLCNELNTYKNYIARPFTLPFIHNNGISLEESIKAVRTNAPFDKEKFNKGRNNGTLNIEKYKTNVMKSLI